MGSKGSYILSYWTIQPAQPCIIKVYKYSGSEDPTTGSIEAIIPLIRPVWSLKQEENTSHLIQPIHPSYPNNASQPARKQVTRAEWEKESLGAFQ